MPDVRSAETTHLTAADRSIADAERQIIEQGQLVRRLKGEGQDATAAARRLQTLEAGLRQLKDNRQAMMRALSAASVSDEAAPESGAPEER